MISDLTIEHSGKILIGTVSVNADSFLDSAVFRVNPSTGKRKLLSDFVNDAQGPVISLAFSAGLATEASKQILPSRKRLRTRTTILSGETFSCE